MSHQRRAYIRALAYVEPRTVIRRWHGNAFLRQRCKDAQARIHDMAEFDGYGTGVNRVIWSMYAMLKLAIALELHEPRDQR